jgi:tight adherence protein B
VIGNLIGIGFAVGLWLAVIAIWPTSKKAQVNQRVAADWPSFIDDVASGVRSGLSLPFSTFDAGQRLPAVQAKEFSKVKDMWDSGVGYMDCLQVLDSVIRNPGFEYFVSTAVIAYEQGGESVPTVLTQLARSLRSGNQLFNEIKGRQAVTVNSAKVAVLAPFVVLLLTGTRSQVRDAYLTELGFLVIACVIIVSWFSFELMKRFAKIPELDLIR